MERILQYKKQKLKSVENRSRYIESIIALIMETDGITQAEMAHRLDISNPTMIGYLKQLREKNLLDESERLDSGGGRRPRYIKINGDSHFSVGVHIKPGYYLLTIVNMKNEMKAKRIVEEVFQNNPEYWKHMNTTIWEFLTQNECNDRAVGIGISVPCALRLEESDILFFYSAQIGDINGTRLSELTQYFDLPLCAEGEASAAGFRYAIQHGIEHLSYIMVNDGIEGAFIEDREIARGNNGLIGLYGHILIHAGGKKCDCGRRGCLEAYCSTNILRDYAGGSLENYWNLLDQKDEDAINIFDEYLENMAIGTLNILTMMDSDVVIGGEIAPGLIKHNNLLIEKIKKLINPNQLHTKLIVRINVDTSDMYSPAVGVAMMQNLQYITSSSQFDMHQCTPPLKNPGGHTFNNFSLP